MSATIGQVCGKAENLNFSANIDYYTHYNVIILMYNVTSEICVFESDLGLVYVIIPQSRSNIRSITHGMLFVYVDCLPSITGSEKKRWKKIGPGWDSNQCTHLTLVGRH